MTSVTSYFGRQNRPRTVTVMIWGIILLALANGWRAAGLIQQGNLLKEFESSLNPWTGVWLALIWCILFLAAAAALWRRRPWTRYLLPALLLTHGLYQIGLVMLFGRSAASRNAWTVIGLLFTLAVLFSVWALNRPSVRWYFKTKVLGERDSSPQVMNIR